MHSPRFLLIGIGGVYNYGCEAIARGTEAIIRKKYPLAAIIYASERPIDDQNRLKGSQVEVVERDTVRKYSAKRIIRKLLSTVGIKWCPRLDSLRMLKGIDAVLSIGGDIYTLYFDGGYSTSFSKFGDAARQAGLLYVLWGASVGPFSANPKAEKVFTKHLKGLSLITARESATVQYLQAIGVSDNVIPCADPAYVVSPEIKADSDSKNSELTIGINLSPLLTLFSSYLIEEIVHIQARTIQECIEKLNARIVLIPHVVCDFNEGDDDLRYLRRIKQAIAPEYHRAVALLDDDIGFIGTKKELIKCDVVIAARMHCAINALAAHVPTIFVSYSRKAIGMCQYVYGNTDWVIPLDEFRPVHTLEKVRLMMCQQKEIRTYLATRIPQIQKDACRPMQTLKEMLEAKETTNY